MLKRAHSRRDATALPSRPRARAPPTESRALRFLPVLRASRSASESRPACRERGGTGIEPPFGEPLETAKDQMFHVKHLFSSTRLFT